MAESESNRTLWVAVAGITATALVGLAATGAAWLSSRDDRSAQRELARDQRTYDRRVSVYLDAIDFIEGQERAYYVYATLAGLEGRGHRGLPTHVPELHEVGGGPIEYEDSPPQRLSTRLRLFGSKEAVEAFKEAQNLQDHIPVSGAGVETRAGVTRSVLLLVYSHGKAQDLPKTYDQAYRAFYNQISRFEKAAHNEVG